jgi:hypothetical protein
MFDVAIDGDETPLVTWNEPSVSVVYTDSEQVDVLVIT